MATKGTKSIKILISFLTILFIASVCYAAQSITTWTGTYNWTYNSTSGYGNLTAQTIGSGYSKGLQTFSFTNGSTPTTEGCTKLRWRLEYDGTNSSWYQNTAQDLSTISAKVVRPYFNGTAYGNGCVVSGVQLSWTPGGAIDSEIVEGLPYLGSDTGALLKNLAPGVGAFIIILGVFGAVAGIIYAIVGIVRRKVSM